MADSSVTLLDNYRRAATSREIAAWNYKGLQIHADPEIHDHVGAMVASMLPRGSKVLDLAAGSGAMCQRLQDLGMVPTGTDIVTENFRLHGKIDFITANLNDDLPPELQGRFDCVTATELIEHLENPRHLVRQCFRMLRPGGVLIVSSPNTESSISMAQFVRTGNFRWFEQDQYHRDGHIMPILLPVLRNALIEADFADIKFKSVKPLQFKGLQWWKMRLLAWALRLAISRPLLEGDFVVVQARRPG